MKSTNDLYFVGNGESCHPEMLPDPEPYSLPRANQAQYAPQEVASKCQGGKEAKFTKKPAHKGVNAFDNLQLANDTGYGFVTETPWSREETGASKCTLLL